MLMTKMEYYYIRQAAAFSEHEQQWVCSLSSVTLTGELRGSGSPGEVQRGPAGAHRGESGVGLRCRKDMAGVGWARKPRARDTESHAGPGVGFRAYFGPRSPAIGRRRRWRLLWPVEQPAFGVLILRFNFVFCASKLVDIISPSLVILFIIVNLYLFSLVIIWQELKISKLTKLSGFFVWRGFLTLLLARN